MAGIVNLVLTAAYLVARARSAPVSEVTISGDGISNHGKPNLICFPTAPTDVLLFFLSNYVAHALTVKMPAGASWRESMLRTLDSLLFPADGVGSALHFMFRWSWRRSATFPYLRMEADSLETALRAGALVVAVRTFSWAPSSTDGILRDLTDAKDDDMKKSEASERRASRMMALMSLKGATAIVGGPSLRNPGPSTSTTAENTSVNYAVQTLPDQDDDEMRDYIFGARGVYGGFELPPGYCWSRLPLHAKLRPYRGAVIDGATATDDTPAVHLTASFSATQPIVAIFQAVNSGWELYKSRGDQLDQFGFAAFSLTLVPYFVMSIANFFAQLATPQYESTYIVYSEVLEEAAARAGDAKILGIVAELVPDESPAAGHFEQRLTGGNNVILTPATFSSPATPTLSQGQKETSITTAEGEGEPSALVPQPAGRTIIVPRHPRFERRSPERKGVWNILEETGGRVYFIYALSVTIALLPVVVIGAITRFDGGQSSVTQRGIMIAWLVSSAGSKLLVMAIYLVALGPWYALLLGWNTVRKKSSTYLWDQKAETVIWIYEAINLACSAIPLAMFAMVGMELMQYGKCDYYG